MKQIKILIVLLFAVLSVQAQTSATIRPAAKLNVSVASGSDPYTLTVSVLDDLSRFSFSDFGVGDSVYLIDGSDLLIYVVTSKLTSPNRLVVDDVNNTGISAPTGQGAIVKSTPNYKLPFYISGLRDDLRSMMMNRLSQLLDSNIATAGGEIYRYIGTSGVAPAVTAAAAGTITAQNTVGEIYTWNPATNLSSGSWSIISGGGGSLTANSVDSTHIKPASIAASDLSQHAIDTIRNNSIQISEFTDTTYYFGNSITYGVSSSNNVYRWTSIVSKLLRTNEVNNGVSGSTLIKDISIPNSLGGGTMIDRLSTIPVYTNANTSKALVFSFGANDIGMGSQTGWDTVAFKRDYRTVLNNAKSKGWSNGKIVLISPLYINSAGFVTYNTAGRPLSNDTRTQQFVTAVAAVASEYSGMKYIDLYAPSKAGDTTNILHGDGVHPTDFGHKFMAGVIIGGMGLDSVQNTASTFKINGGADIQGLSLRNLPYIGVKGYYIGVDTLGRVGIRDNVSTSTYTIPSLLSTGSFNANSMPTISGISGAFLQYGSNIGYLFAQDSSNTGQVLSINHTGGRVLIGGASDDNSSKLQVLGNTKTSGYSSQSSFIATGNTNPTGAGLIAQYNANIGYVFAFDYSTSTPKDLSLGFFPPAKILYGDNTTTGTTRHQFTGTTYHKNPVGFNQPNPLYYIDADGGSFGNPIRALGLQAGSASDSLVSSASGVLKRVASVGAITAGEGNSHTVNATIAAGANLSGGGTPFTVTVSGALVGDFIDFVVIPDDNDLTDIVIKAWVSATNTVSYQIENKRATSVVFTNKSVKARVRR